MVSNAVENQVITLPTLGEILLRVINDLICAERSDDVDIPRTADAGHICPERLGDLHSERAHASRRPVNQDFLPRLKLSLVTKTLQRGVGRHGNSSRLLRCYVVWLHDQC